jgi:4-amino-4-deoxy-L-arabinose transferase-like glycosyltransferase/protein tyrosine phosphatase (PTP) superfamily phosphohydrolase (DUF442 family)
MREMSSPLRYTLYGLAALLGIFVYFFGLDSQHIPKNGDEMAYANVSRMTAASGRWLPLQADVPDMRNTKPPLLFWQGIVSTDQGRSWSLWNLRYPSVIYSLLTALLAFLLAWRSSGVLTRGFDAALIYLAFYSTYRYGRPFLTNPPETFWLFLAYFILLCWKDAALSSRGRVVLLGAVIGIGLLYKSFALLLPVGLALSWCCLHRRHYRWREFLHNDAWKLGVLAAIALATFCLWFALDPDPQSLWREFVVKENADKFAPAGGSYLSELLWGGSSIWTMILSAPVNAGLLALPVAASMAAALRDRGRLSTNEKLLWIWVLTLIVVFSLPSQRSARYLLDAMPAVAVLCALGWGRLGRGWFVATLGLCVLGLSFLAYESWLLQRAMPGGLFSIGYWLLLMAAAGFCAAAILLPPLTRPAAPVAALLVFLSMAAFLTPIDHELGEFSAQASRYVSGREVWVPSEFAASEEAYRFMLPTATIRSYVEARDENVDELARRYPVFAVRLPLQGTACTGCRVLAQRLDLRGRLSSADIAQLLHGRAFDTLFIKELLVESVARQSTDASVSCDRHAIVIAAEENRRGVSDGNLAVAQLVTQPCERSSMPASSLSHDSVFATSTARLIMILVLPIVLLVAGLAYGYWVTVEHRLTVITPGRVYQSAAMPPADLIRIAQRLGIQTVFDFRGNSENERRLSTDEQRALEQAGIKYFHIASSISPAPETVATFLRVMTPEVAAHRTVLFHCHDGEGRAVFYSAIYRIQFEGWDNEQAYLATTRLPPSLMFLRKIFPSVARLSPRNAKTPLIFAFRRQQDSMLLH